MSKFNGLTSWNMISLRECDHRRKAMVEQFEKYGVSNYRFYQTDRWVNLKQNSKIISHHEYAPFHYGTCLSHLESLRYWYLTTNEPYAIFSDDDVDLSTSEYWNFDFAEFVESLPEGWECVQLLRRWAESDRVLGFDAVDANLTLFWGRWFGVQALMTRKYVERVLSNHVFGFNSYDLRVVRDDFYNGDPNTISYVENVLFMNNGMVMNFPLFVELDTESTIFANNTTDPYHRLSREVFLELWKKHGSTLSIKQVLATPLWISNLLPS